jgi:hypothetical protein
MAISEALVLFFQFMLLPLFFLVSRLLTNRVRCCRWPRPLLSSRASCSLPNKQLLSILDKINHLHSYPHDMFHAALAGRLKGRSRASNECRLCVQYILIVSPKNSVFVWR